LGDEQLDAIRGVTHRALAPRIGAELSGNDRTGAGERQAANAENKNRDYRFNECVSVGHATTLVESAAARVIRALRAKSNHLDSVASP
jgi:hypothetical protein